MVKFSIDHVGWSTRPRRRDFTVGDASNCLSWPFLKLLTLGVLSQRIECQRACGRHAQVAHLLDGRPMSASVTGRMCRPTSRHVLGEPSTSNSLGF